jgi:hypothetical protein
MEFVYTPHNRIRSADRTCPLVIQRRFPVSLFCLYWHYAGAACIGCRLCSSWVDSVSRLAMAAVSAGAKRRVTLDKRPMVVTLP